MPTTFNVFYLGVQAVIDPTEGNNTAEDAGDLVGLTFGSIGDPLVNHIHSFSPGTAGYSGGTSDKYDTDQTGSADEFTIDGGADQIHDATANYNATITYTDGTTDTISAVIFQDTAGNTYLAPENSANADQASLEAKPIRSLTLDSYLSSSSGLLAEREEGNYLTCFAFGTLIETPLGPVPVERIAPGDLVTTRDAGAQPVLWAGARHLDAAHLALRPEHRPIRIRAGALGNTRDLTLSPQHMVLVDWQGREFLARAKHLPNLIGGKARQCRGVRAVSYAHLFLAHHHVLNAEGAPCESLYPGPITLAALSDTSRLALHACVPGLRFVGIFGRGLVEAVYGPRTRPVLRSRDLKRARVGPVSGGRIRACRADASSGAR